MGPHMRPFLLQIGPNVRAHIIPIACYTQGRPNWPIWVTIWLLCSPEQPSCRPNQHFSSPGEPFCSSEQPFRIEFLDRSSGSNSLTKVVLPDLSTQPAALFYTARFVYTARSQTWAPSWAHRDPNLTKHVVNIDPNMGPSWVHIGFVFGPSCAHFWNILGPVWYHIGPTTGYTQGVETNEQTRNCQIDTQPCRLKWF
jgi:hypothetical protein